MNNELRLLMATAKKYIRKKQNKSPSKTLKDIIRKNGRREEEKPSEATKSTLNEDLLDVRQYRSSVKALNFIKKYCNIVSTLSYGGLYLFSYNDPKTKKYLDVYDALPCSLIYDAQNGTEGITFSGFNIHFMAEGKRNYFLRTGNVGNDFERCIKRYISRRTTNIYEIPNEWRDIAAMTQGIMNYRSKRQIS